MVPVTNAGSGELSLFAVEAEGLRPAGRVSSGAGMQRPGDDPVLELLEPVAASTRLGKAGVRDEALTVAGLAAS